MVGGMIVEKQIQLFINVDSEGNIKMIYSGENIIATEPFDFFFLTDEETIDNLVNYKVTIVGFKPTLTLKASA